MYVHRYVPDVSECIFHVGLDALVADDELEVAHILQVDLRAEAGQG
jgi:hypothetical protein